MERGGERRDGEGRGRGRMKREKERYGVALGADGRNGILSIDSLIGNHLTIKLSLKLRFVFLTQE